MWYNNFKNRQKNFSTYWRKRLKHKRKHKRKQEKRNFKRIHFLLCLFLSECLISYAYALADYARLKTRLNICCSLTVKTIKGGCLHEPGCPRFNEARDDFRVPIRVFMQKTVNSMKIEKITDGYLIGLSGRHLWSQFEVELGTSTSLFLFFSSAMIRTCFSLCTKTRWKIWREQ